MTERWQPIRGYEEAYQISDHGRVRSITRRVTHWRGGTRTVEGRFRVPGRQREGYLSVHLYREQRFRKFYVHRLVALHFVANPDRLPEVNHADGDKTNNHHSNLLWATKSDNCRHARDAHLYEPARGERAAGAKLTEADVRMIRAIAAAGVMHKELAAQFGVGRKAITKIVNRQRWAHVH